MITGQWIDTLRQQSIKRGWHIQQGKGENSGYEQDILSHSMDVVRIAYNIAAGLDPELRFTQEDIVTVAFFHDLHKVDRVGGTNSMDEAEVEALLSDWEVRQRVLNRLNLQEFVDVLRAIHPFHGDDASRARINADPEIATMVNVVRLADIIASAEEITELYDDDNRSAWECVQRLNTFANTEYTLGHHHLSEVKPGLGAILHQSVRNVLHEDGAIPLGSRTDFTVYLFPPALSSEQLHQNINDELRERCSTNRIIENTLEKVRTSVFGSAANLQSIIRTHRESLEAEGGNDDLSDEYRKIASTIGAIPATDDPDSYSVTTGEATFFSVDTESNNIIVEVPTTQKGYVIGHALAKLTEELDSQTNLDRLSVITELINPDIDLDAYSGLNWRTKQTILARLLGNRHHQRTDASAEVLLDTMSSRASELSEDENRALDRVGEYVNAVLDVRTSKADGVETLHKATGISDLQRDHDFGEACILCGRAADFDYRTKARGEFSEFSASYMIRGLAGHDPTTDDWRLCAHCLLDNTLLRAAVSDADEIDDVEDTIFLKVLPNRYLSGVEVGLVRNTLSRAFEWLREDAERYLATAEGFDLDQEAVISYPGYEEDYKILLDEPVDVQSLDILIGSPNFLLLAVEDSSDNDVTQLTLTWIKAILRGLILYRFHNLNVIIENDPIISSDQIHQTVAGIQLVTPPSQIRSVFTEDIRYDEVDSELRGLANLVYTLNFPQYTDESDVVQAYNEFRQSLFPGSRLYRSAERELESDHLSVESLVEEAVTATTAIDDWKNRG
jgi:HD superfamily phosphodiesterase